MEFREHLLDFLRSVSRNVHTGGKALPLTGEDNCGDVGPGFEFSQCMAEFLHHGNVDHVQRRMAQSDPRDGWSYIDSES